MKARSEGKKKKRGVSVVFWAAEFSQAQTGIPLPSSFPTSGMLPNLQFT